MKYFVEEYLTHDDGTVTHEMSEPLEEDDAEEKYYLRAATVAKSVLPCHAVAMTDSEAHMIHRKAHKFIAKEETPDE